jgi:hypothetical protein
VYRLFETLAAGVPLLAAVRPNGEVPIEALIVVEEAPRRALAICARRVEVRNGVASLAGES